MNFMYCKPRPSDWTYSVVGYHSSLLSWKPGFESWYVRHQSGVNKHNYEALIGLAED